MSADERYDRQLRLWGSHGQDRLARASILCLGSSPGMAETLKNLVLPGVGNICLVDDSAIIGEKDLALNFFFLPSDLGRNRCEVLANRLKELNPTDCSIWVGPDDRSWDVVLKDDFEHAAYFASDHIVQIGNHGFVGKVQLFGYPHIVIESREERVEDYRLTNPWPELKQWALRCITESPHVPFFATLILAPVASDAHWYLISALRSELEVVDDLKRIVGYAHAGGKVLDQTIAVVEKVLKFYQKFNVLPLSTATVPDMDCSTETYTELVDIYRAKFEADLAQLLCDELPEEFVRQVVKNIRHLSVVEFEKYEKQKENSQFALNSISTIVGAVAAQEIVKLITHQFVPISGLWAFDGTNSTTV